MDTETIPVDLAALSSWMDEQGLSGGDITGANLLAGGTQNILLRFDRGGKSYVLRRPPIHMRKNSNKTMEREATVLAALRGSNVPHPGFIASCSDQDVLGASFYLMEPIVGFNFANGLPQTHKLNADFRFRMGMSHMEALTALGAVDYRAVGLENFGKVEGFLERQAPRWLAQLDRYAHYDNWPGLGEAETVSSIANWLTDNCPKAFEPGIIHGDAHIANVMFSYDSGEVAALIDWELATIGDPLVDLGWIMATWPEDDGSQTLVLGNESYDGLPKLSQLVEHYGENSSRDLSAISWYGVLGCFKLAMILEGTYARSCAGKASKEVGDAMHATALKLLDRAQRLKAA